MEAVGEMKAIGLDGCNGTIKMEATGLHIWMTGIEMMGTGMMSNHKCGVCS